MEIDKLAMQIAINILAVTIKPLSAAFVFSTITHS
jgi:hypothetical protein